MTVSLICSFSLTPVFGQTSNGISMPTAPIVSIPTAPTVSYPTTVTLSTDSSSYSATSTTSTENQSTGASTNNSSTTTDLALTSLATSALQQIVGSTNFSDSTNTLSSSYLENLLSEDLSNSASSILQNPTKYETTTRNCTTQNYGKLLRCSINGVEKATSFKNCWVSKPENNGAFLFTGTYFENQSISDIFYMYFIPDSSSNYTVSISTEKDSDTFFKSFASSSNDFTITAQRTGNLVAMRQNNSNLSLDLLLSIDFTAEL